MNVWFYECMKYLGRIAEGGIRYTVYGKIITEQCQTQVP